MAEKIGDAEITAAYKALEEFLEPTAGTVKEKSAKAVNFYEWVGVDEEALTLFGRERADALAKKIMLVNPTTAALLGLSEAQMADVFVVASVLTAFMVGLQVGRTESGFTWTPTS